jgi:hypothetical protein
MKRRYTILIVLLTITVLSASGQEPVKKSKQEIKLEKQKETEEMLNSKTFVFVARTAFPSGGRSTTISSGASTVKFTPELITSDLPFFGTSTRPAGYGTDSGLKFEGKPEEYTQEQKKKGYEISLVVKTNDDSYRINLTASSDGYASLSINSNNRSPMSYSGIIEKPEEKK